MSMSISHRRGFTLLEMLIALTILGVIGAAATKLLTTQQRYFSNETNQRNARSIARSGMNVLLSDLRMVQDSGGVDSVSSDGKLIRVIVPYRFGINCGANVNGYTFSMLPIDSSVIATAVYGGYAYRDSASGRYTIVTPPAPLSTNALTASTNASLCTGGTTPFRTLSINGRSGSIIDVSPTAVLGTPKVGAPVFLWQKVTYKFAASTVFPGFIALWRKTATSNSELIAPFDTSARFRFYQTGDDTSRVTVPSLDKIRGLDIVLNAKSPRAASGGSTNKTTNVITSVFFKNVRAF